MGYYDPMPDLVRLVEAMVPELAMVTIGPPKGNEPTPFAVIRTVSGLSDDPQFPEAERTIDVVIYGDSVKQANEVSNELYWQIRRRYVDRNYLNPPNRDAPQPVHIEKDGQVITFPLPSLFPAGGPFDLVDPDRKLPGVMRSYELTFCEDDGM